MNTIDQLGTPPYLLLAKGLEDREVVEGNEMETEETVMLRRHVPMEQTRKRSAVKERLLIQDHVSIFFVSGSLGDGPCTYGRIHILKEL